MKALIQSWYKPRWWTLFLLPLAFIFYLIIKIRKLCYQFNIFKTTTFPVPVIVVGNITVGGTGKTPLVIWLVVYLKSQGYRPGVVSRGYVPGNHRKNSIPLLVTTNSHPEEVGDEPILITKRTSVPVMVGIDRVKTIQILLENHNRVVDLHYTFQFLNQQYFQHL
jgi:tetraacyldisaccharide 4'-kinase